MTFPAAPFAATPMLLLTPPDSDLRVFLEEAHRLVVAEPALLTAIDADLDAHGKRKKALRLADARWLAARSQTLPGVVVPCEPIDPATLTLGVGRARTPAYVVLMALLLRGYAGAGFKACDALTLMVESITLHVFFTHQGLAVPGASTLTELVNAVQNDTRARVLDAQVRQITRAGWDDFETMLQDSTAVEGHTAWPSDSRTLVALVERVLRVGASLARVGLTPFELPKVRAQCAAMAALDREIDLSTGRRDTRARTRRRRYTKLLALAQGAHGLLAPALTRVAAECATLDVAPSRHALAARAVQQLRADHAALAQVLDTCRRRVLDDEKVPMAAKVLSTSDPDVGFIAKGQREAVVGYKPQLARSGAGFVTSLQLPRGNAADAQQLTPVFEEVVRRTGVRPKVVSLDDGYASAANVAMLRAAGVEVRSINGSKGKKLTARRDWQSDDYAAARDLRSAVESLMFTIKHGFAFGVVARRGLANVYGELLEKVLAYNLCRMARTRLGRAADTPLEAALAA